MSLIGVEPNEALKDCAYRGALFGGLVLILLLEPAIMEYNICVQGNIMLI